MFVLFSDRPVNISISVDPPHVVKGSSVKLTCSSAANPAADNYTWYKRAVSANSLLPMGSGRVLSIPTMEASHTGLYLCRASNRMGENNSTEVLLSIKAEENGLCHFTVQKNHLKWCTAKYSYIFNREGLSDSSPAIGAALLLQKMWHFFFILLLKWHKTDNSNQTIGCVSPQAASPSHS